MICGFSNSLWFSESFARAPVDSHPNCLIPKKYEKLVDPKSPKKFSLRLFDLLTLMLMNLPACLFLANDNYLHLGYYGPWRLSKMLETRLLGF